MYFSYVVCVESVMSMFFPLCVVCYIRALFLPCLLFCQCSDEVSAVFTGSVVYVEFEISEVFIMAAECVAFFVLCFVCSEQIIGYLCFMCSADECRV